MTPLEVARQMIAQPPFYYDGGKHCGFCDGCMDIADPEHDPDCLWPQMPCIVAALEAAERFAQIGPYNCSDCLDYHPHAPECERLTALAEAMRG